MKIEEKVHLDVVAEDMWKVMNDIPVIAKCIPGVEAFEPEGDNVYIGSIKMKVGPIAVNFKGKITVLEVDEEQRKISMRAEASDSRIGSNVKVVQTLSVIAADGGSDFAVEADVDMRGKLAQLGWGLIRPKVTSTMQEFAENLRIYMEENKEEAPETDQISSALD
ncbi:SRPBCC family protein [Ferviditalea candida]|uniref:SRPBCC family protein n=1 Tax=Ferviditalea candida TaxID=3108399 RepID=A0ABU5ZM83_9BACL|nr:SRPBCC family protein [Paenibacillaceae bacterium T2]